MGCVKFHDTELIEVKLSEEKHIIARSVQMVLGFVIKGFGMGQRGLCLPKGGLSLVCEYLVLWLMIFISTIYLNAKNVFEFKL